MAKKVKKKLKKVSKEKKEVASKKKVIAKKVKTKSKKETLTKIKKQVKKNTKSTITKFTKSSKKVLIKKPKKKAVESKDKNAKAVSINKKEKFNSIGSYTRKKNNIEVPKIKSKKSILYKPDFTKSILNKEEEEDKAKRIVTNRYNDEDLNFFKELIVNKIEVSKNELFYLQNVLSQKGDNMRPNNVLSGSLEEEMGMDKEQFTQMARRQQQFINHLEKALIRIKNKTYGVCRITGKLIDKDRLKAVPHATLSVEAKMMNLQNKGDE